MDDVTLAEVIALLDDSERRLVEAVQRGLEDLAAGMTASVQRALDELAAGINQAFATRGPELVTGPTIRQVHRDPEGNISRLEEWAPFTG